MSAISVVLDVDTGTDDAGALVWAATSPGVDLVAATATWGNCAAPQAARNTLLMLEAAGCDAPVHVGCAGPSGPAPGGLEATLLMGVDGLGDLGLPDPRRTPDVAPATEALVRIARAAPGAVHLVAVAPLSTVAAALVVEPELPSLFSGLTVMGGAISVGGNLSAAAEANIAHDPLAAAAVIEAFGRPGALAAGEPPRLVPLDVTLGATFTDDDLAALGDSRVPGAALLHRVWSAKWSMANLESGGLGMPVHDLLAAWTVRHPATCTWELLPLSIDTGQSAAWGATVADRRLRLLDKSDFDAETRRSFETMMGASPSRWSIATGVDTAAFRAGIRAWLRGDT